MSHLDLMPEHRQQHWLTTPLHTYTVGVTPKSMGEALARAQLALQRHRDAGGDVPDSTLEIVGLLLDECKRKRPAGPGGKHGDLHTAECGCVG